ncbi:LmbE family N-acetylglucosaminyl deacetylase [Kitasatospora sp. MAP12-15]|uniref:PIG-L deacetylase family protein n=1 Tax=unclassified Kitasatospora TaxID=2633591 RepID=UPI0024758AE8|nr:PIG-L family deacetylase [Kitasatospora sp. MAP12-44]MDH6114553.1 LmbE family N-acetylglucosaminyl deacetylase [Kitasatospora sp. MAP12-44]
MTDRTDRRTDQLTEMPTDWTRALAIVAHPDDIEYAAAAAVATWVDQGKEIVYLMASRGEAGIDGMDPEQAKPIREREQRASAAVVGVTEVEFLDHQDGLIDYGPELRRELAHAVRRHRPDLILTLNHHDHWRGVSWNTPDHRNVGRAALDAAADAANRYLFPEEGLEPWEGVRWQAVANSPYPTHAVDVTWAVERGVQAVLAHATYLEALTDEDPAEYVRGFLGRNLAAAGERFGGRPAVAFEVFHRDPYRKRNGELHYR